MNDAQKNRLKKRMQRQQEADSAALRMAIHRIDSKPRGYNYLLQIYSKEYVAHMIGRYGDDAVEMANECVRAFFNSGTTECDAAYAEDI